MRRIADPENIVLGNVSEHMRVNNRKAWVSPDNPELNPAESENIFVLN